MPPFFMPPIIIFFQKPLLLKNKSSTFAKILRTKDTKSTNRLLFKQLFI